MKKILFTLIALLSLTSCSVLQKLDSNRLMQGGAKALQAFGVTNDQLMGYVKLSVLQLDAGAIVLPPSNNYSRRLARITKGLTSVGGIPLNFKVYKTNEPNAFACADGSVRIYTGLMDIMNDYELLGVIGHEIGHVAMEHTLNAYKHALYASTAFDVIASTGDFAAALTDSVLGDLGQNMISAGFSRKQEIQADNYGYDFLKGAGINPWYMAMAFEQLQAASQKGSLTTSSGIGTMFSSHPDTAARIEGIAKRCREDGFTRPEK
jgi:putative metalloprotease